MRTVINNILVKTDFYIWFNHWSRLMFIVNLSLSIKISEHINMLKQTFTTKIISLHWLYGILEWALASFTICLVPIMFFLQYKRIAWASISGSPAPRSKIFKTILLCPLRLFLDFLKYHKVNSIFLHFLCNFLRVKSWSMSFTQIPRQILRIVNPTLNR